MNTFYEELTASLDKLADIIDPDNSAEKPQTYNDSLVFSCQRIADHFKAGGALPEVTAEDDGDVLTVVDGEWGKAAPSGGGGLLITLTDETSRWINPDTGDPAQSFCMYPDPNGYFSDYAIVPESVIQEALSGVPIALTDEQETEPQFTDYQYLFAFAVQRYELEGSEIDPTDVDSSSFYSPDDMVEVAVIILYPENPVILLPDTATYLPPGSKDAPI